MKLPIFALMAAVLAVPVHPALSQETRTITDLVGEVEVPVDPQRIVVTDGDNILQPTVALGLVPVGASRNPITGDYAKVVAERLPEDLAYIGAPREPDYEEVLMLEPDLILMSNDELPDEDGMYSRFSDIAPTVLINQDQVLWKQALLDVANATGREAEARELLDRYEARLAEVRSVIGDRATTASVMRIRADHLRYMAQDSSYVWDILKELGFRAPDQQEKSSPSAFVRVSLEQIDVVDAPLIIVLEDQGAVGPGGMAEQIKQLPAFQSLSGEKIHLPTGEYLFGNILTAFEFLDLLEQHFEG
ncbi:ABC transporter substrate-binding protein [Aureimonas populi]|uniref:ABC transporter substrate-binding protein n=1 Tax=Aureimonas populi TaxID=1701758 RepID=A0ABW5CQ68_9HYPH|nr:ABC transporter substrate-binding protein [Aureimonas populi]